MPAPVIIKFSRFGRSPFAAGAAGAGPATPAGLGRSLLMLLVAAFGLLVVLPILIVGGLLVALLAAFAAFAVALSLRVRLAWRRLRSGARSDDSGRENVRVVRADERAGR